jgi:hypothetical protein
MCASEFLSRLYPVCCSLGALDCVLGLAWGQAATYGQALLTQQSFRTEMLTAVAQTTAPVAEESHSWPLFHAANSQDRPKCAICGFANAWMVGNIYLKVV